MQFRIHHDDEHILHRCILLIFPARVSTFPGGKLCRVDPNVGTRHKFRRNSRSPQTSFFGTRHNLAHFPAQFMIIEFRTCPAANFRLHGANGGKPIAETINPRRASILLLRQFSDRWEGDAGLTNLEIVADSDDHRRICCWEEFKSEYDLETPRQETVVWLGIDLHGQTLISGALLARFMSFKLSLDPPVFHFLLRVLVDKMLRSCTAGLQSRMPFLIAARLRPRIY